MTLNFDFVLFFSWEWCSWGWGRSCLHSTCEKQLRFRHSENILIVKKPVLNPRQLWDAVPAVARPYFLHRCSYLAFYSPSLLSSIHPSALLAFSAAETQARERSGGAWLEWNERRADRRWGGGGPGMCEGVVKYLAYPLLLLFLWGLEVIAGHWHSLSNSAGVLDMKRRRLMLSVPRYFVF